MGAYREKQVRAAEANGQGRNPCDPAWQKKRPAIHEFVSELVDTGGNPIKGATVMFFAEDGVFKVVLHDRQGCCSLWATSDTIEGVFDALEKRLCAGTGDWRKDRPEGSGRKRG